MSADSFVHLHLHTEYSTLDGANRIPKVFERAKGFGMPAVAITDHGNMFGAVEWLQEGEKTGVKPIVGCEVYMAPGSLHEKKGLSQRDASFHFTLLAENEEGYRNLVKLVSYSGQENHYAFGIPANYSVATNSQNYSHDPLSFLFGHLRNRRTDVQ